MEMQAFSFAASGFVLTAGAHIQRLSTCGTGLVQLFGNAVSWYVAGLAFTAYGIR
jgi:hypothetical protein